MTTEFDKLKNTWDCLGREDPLWAIVSHDDKRGGKWKLDEFLQTGESDVQRMHEILEKNGACATKFDHVLDFGCGVGRLCLAWSRRAQQVTGVDISEPMIDQGTKLLADVENVRLQLNQKDDLGCFAAEQFDLVSSYICLQHMPWPIASKYISEFSRICRTNGWVIFQLPAQGGNLQHGFRKKLVESLPFGLSKVYRRWRRGVEVVFEMFYTPAETVIQHANSAGLKLVHREKDEASGKDAESYIYLFRKQDL